MRFDRVEIRTGRQRITLQGDLVNVVRLIPPDVIEVTTAASPRREYEVMGPVTVCVGLTSGVTIHTSRAVLQETRSGKRTLILHLDQPQRRRARA